MTEKHCDFCFKNVDELVEIKDEYKADRRVEMCRECEKQVTDVFFNITKALNIQRDNWFRNFIKNFKR